MKFNSLDFQIFVGDILEKCKTEEEVEFLREEMTGIVEGNCDERLEELEK